MAQMPLEQIIDTSNLAEMEYFLIRGAQERLAEIRSFIKEGGYGYGFRRMLEPTCWLRRVSSMRIEKLVEEQGARPDMRSVPLLTPL